MSKLIGHVFYPDGTKTIVHPEHGCFFDPRDIRTILQTENWDYKELERDHSLLVFFPLYFNDETNTNSNLNENASEYLGEEYYGIIFLCTKEDYLEIEVTKSTTTQKAMFTYDPNSYIEKTGEDVDSLARSVLPIAERIFKGYEPYEACYYLSQFNFTVADFTDCKKSFLNNLATKFHLGKTKLIAHPIGGETCELGELSWGFVTGNHNCTPYILHYLYSGEGFSMYEAFMLKYIGDYEFSDFPFSEYVDALWSCGKLKTPNY